MVAKKVSQGRDQKKKRERERKIKGTKRSEKVKLDKWEKEKKTPLQNQPPETRGALECPLPQPHLVVAPYRAYLR